MADHRQILLIEDNPGDAQLIRHMLLEKMGTAFELAQADRLEQGLQLLADHQVDVILLDLSLPDSQGLGTFARVYRSAAQVPIIVLTGWGDEEQAIEAIRRGAQDYLIKGQVDGDLLSRSIRYAIERKQSARQMDRLRVLNQLDRALAATLDLDRVAEITVRQIAEATEAPTGALFVLFPRNELPTVRTFVLRRGWVDMVTAEEDMPSLRAVLGHAQDDGAVVPLSADAFVQICPRGHAGASELWGAFGLVVPVWNDDQLIAALALAGRPADRPFTGEDLALARAAANRAGQAIWNARLYDELRTLLRERERTQAQLIHSEKMSALGRLMASVAHEINNPLQSMQGCLTLALEEWADRRRPERMVRYLDIIRDEIERVSEIVRRMRDFYRSARAGFQPTDLHAVLANVLELSRKQLQHSDVQVERAWADDVPLVEANPNHLKQVFLNLLLNAIDAMPEGGTLRIATARDETPAHPGSTPPAAVRLEFQDTGVGMPPETLSRLFEPFFTTKEKGSGLGLSVSYGIIETHHGRIWATSRPGEGTTFTILLPLKQPKVGPG